MQVINKIGAQAYLVLHSFLSIGPSIGGHDHTEIKHVTQFLICLSANSTLNFHLVKILVYYQRFRLSQGFKKGYILGPRPRYLYIC